MHFIFFFFFFNDTATTEIYTLSLHDALPIYALDEQMRVLLHQLAVLEGPGLGLVGVADEVLVHLALGDEGHLLSHRDRKSTRLNSSHANISYAVFCLKKKKKNIQ